MAEALPTHPHGQRLCELFPYRWKFLEADLSSGYDKVDWKTNDKYPLKARVLWSRHQDPNILIGVRFGAKTSYAVLDIDRESPYLADCFEIQRLTDSLETIGINRTVLIRSSWSGGLHIYIPLPKPVRTFSLACALRQCLEAQGFQIANGQLEIFPNTKDYAKTWLGEAFSEYQGHRLPLQPHTGSCLLDTDLNPLPGGEDLSRFFMQWDNASLFQDMDCLEESLTIARNNRRNRLRRAAKGPIEDWRQDLEQIISEGWTGFGQTNQLLKEIACYGRVFEKLSGFDLEQYVARIAESRPGFEQYCRHAHEIWKRATMWAHAVEKFYWPLGETPLREGKSPDQEVSYNQTRAAEARSRIAMAMSWVRTNLDWEESGNKVGWLVRQLCEMARCSAQTLYRNLDIWHPAHRSVNDVPVVDTAAIPPPDASISAIAESDEKSTVTPSGGGNEVWIPETAPKKIFTSGMGVERGARGESGGFPQPLADILTVENLPWGWCDG